MSVVEFNVSPKYKKSFIEYNYLEKNIKGKKIKLVRELVWRNGNIIVIVNNNKFKEFNNAKELFNSIKKHQVLLFNDEFPFEYEFVSSWDGCSDDYSLTYEDGSEVEEELEEEIMNIIEEEGIDELEDNHDFIMTDTIYEIDGELDIQKLN
tara:strand:- start:1629 stop:2081 length:453 start_codon:yes stop_codon:yes gene_type:complete